MSWLIGIDTGGTFTDLYARSLLTGAVHIHKRPSTPDDPSRAVIEGLLELCSLYGIEPRAITRLGHGTTVGTNALIQRQGGRVALVTTRGFRDLLEIGRQTRPHMFDLQMDRPAPLVPRERRLEIEERITADGSVLEDCDLSEVDHLAAALKELEVDAVAVCLIFSFLNPRHERAVGERLAAHLPTLKISLSSEVRPEFREYERFSTTTINAYMQPVMDQYLAALHTNLTRIVGEGSIGLNQSNGGLMSLEIARKFPVRTALSGPAAGAVGAVKVAEESARPNIITVDVGGTSADMALIRDYEVALASERDVADFPVRLPMFDVHTIGAGGGSIAWFDKDGLLKVGPDSAGARPGPACYGLGGQKPTVSDANLVLGRLGSKLVNGAITLDVGRSKEILAPIAARLGKSVEQAALGVVQIVVANMVRAIRTISVERGHDPREFVLMPFGGAGPLHARDIAIDLGIGEILVPASPGILCAEGLVVAEQKEDFVTSQRLTLSRGAKLDFWPIVSSLLGKARHWFGEESTASEQQWHELTIDARYKGQNFELQLPIASGLTISEAAMPSAETIVSRFISAHRVAYGYASDHDPIEIINTRMTAKIRRTPGPQALLDHGRSGSSTPVEYRNVWFNDDQPVPTPIFERNSLKPGSTLVGPAIIEQFDTTTPVYPGDKVTILNGGHLAIEVIP
ncbi:MAG: hydantoinase/oxoprolinase family protein [Parvibaculaceae bacterium]